MLAPIMDEESKSKASGSESSQSSGSSSSQILHKMLHAEPPGPYVVVPETMETTDKVTNIPADGFKEYFFGIGSCRPKWMQIFRNSKFFTLILCLNGLIEGALVSGFTSVVISSIERRYKFSSVLAGLIASVFDMSVLVSVLLISYFGGRGHKPKWLGVSLIIQGIGAFVFSLPQFVFGQYEVGSNQQFESCTESDFSSDCAPGNNFALVFFFIGNILIGIGAAPLFTVGTSYLDDIIHPKYVTIHLGIFYTCAVVGPAMGYGLGGLFLSIYVDPWVNTSLEPSDPGWVGAWWICFIFSGIISWLCAIPFLLFPKLLPDSHFVKAERAKEMAQNYEGTDSMVEEVDIATKFKTFPQHLRLVLATPSWIFITVAICFSTLIVSGVTSFAPKYLESQFGLTASQSSLIAGAIAIPSGGAGVFVGSLIIYFTKSKGRNVALINWIVTLMALLPTFAFLIHCPTLELVGVNVEYPDGSTASSSMTAFNSSCIAPCNCNSTIFEPICGEDGYTYFSPCRAGCQKVFRNDTAHPMFENCTCIANRLYPNENNSLLWEESVMVNGTAREGRCNQGCKNLGIFLGVIFIALFLIFILQVPNVIITVRSVADEQRTLALGAQSVLFRTFGSIPGPIVFGAIFDSSCIYWQNGCTGRGNCWVYDNKPLSERAVSLAMSGIGVNLIFSFLSWLAYPKKTASEKTVVDAHLMNIQSSSTDENNNDNEPLENKSKLRPTSRSATIRMDSHCSQDILLESTEF